MGAPPQVGASRPAAEPVKAMSIVERRPRYGGVNLVNRARDRLEVNDQLRNSQRSWRGFG
jgi:hypothetical protein